MSPETGRSLGPLVKGKHFHALLDYANERIAYFHKQLETETSVDRIREYQGAILELKRMRTLDKEAEQAAKDDR